METKQKLPSEVLDLTNWYLTLPVGKPKDPTCVYQPELDKFSLEKHFYVNPTGDAVVFNAHAGGVTTSGTKNPRSELREMFGSKKAIWSTKKGKHTMVLKQAVKALPTGKPSVVVAQIHRGSDDLIEVRCWVPKNSKTQVIDVFHNDTVYGVLCPKYQLGEIYTLKIEAANNVVNLYFNEATTPTVSIKASCDTCFFKAGCYTQANPSVSGVSSDMYGEVHIYDVKVKHEDS